jgi:hypothetical protein
MHTNDRALLVLAGLILARVPGLSIAEAATEPLPQPQPLRLETALGAITAVGWELEDIGFGPGYRGEIRFSPPETVQLRSGQPARVRLGGSE